ncbi:MAG TPA: ATP-binding protein, partial [Candidatus Binatia bacterium]|nr:ATP-binding protein [Candidatus Binatia bacterium]
LADAASANAKFRAFFEQGALFAGIMSLDGTIIEPNRLSLDACGYTREDVVGKKFWDCPWWNRSPALMAQIEAGSAQAARGETFRAELPYFIADGTQRMVDFILLPITDDAGCVTFLAPTGTDITAQRRLEHDLRQLAADLADADRRKNEFLAMLAHELRNPLAPIRNALRIMHLTDNEDATIRTTSDMMERQVAHMVRLVDDLLDVSRISRGQIELRTERTELMSVVHHAVEAIRPLCDGMRHELTVTAPPRPIYLNGDPIRLAQVLGNLLNNACKYTEPGGRIRLSVERNDDQAVLRIRDTGVGIAPDKAPLIFNMFTQIDVSLERSQSGLGIGLTLVRTIVEMHGGTVSAESDGLGHGSEFVVRLPALLDVLAPKRRDARVAPPQPSTGLRILVVDDNDDSATSLAMLLELAGHETTTAADGLAAIEAALTSRPDVVLLDIGLPKLNGYEAARRIRAQPGGAAMTLIALTGWGQDEDRRKSREAGFDNHMVKPVDYEALTTLLEELPARTRAS